MGFGILFIGYFLLFNFTYFGFTDVIAAAIMAAGLYKLSTVNRDFKLAFYTSVVFLIYGIPELIVFALKILEIYYSTTLIGYLSIGGSVIVSVMTAFIMKGIYSVSREVELEKIPFLAKFSIFLSFVVYVLWIVCNAPFLTDVLGKSAAYVYFFAIIALLLYVGFNLYVIYGCYMRICMPGEENGKAPKSSRFGFVNSMREKRAEREREEFEYRLERIKKKSQKRKKK